MMTEENRNNLMFRDPIMKILGNTCRSHRSLIYKSPKDPICKNPNVRTFKTHPGPLMNRYADLNLLQILRMSIMKLLKWAGILLSMDRLHSSMLRIFLLSLGSINTNKSRTSTIFRDISSITKRTSNSFPFLPFRKWTHYRMRSVPDT